MRCARLLATTFIALLAAHALACSSPPSDPGGYYHRSGATVHSDTFPDHNADAGRYGRHPVGVRRPGH